MGNTRSKDALTIDKLPTLREVKEDLVELERELDVLREERRIRNEKNEHEKIKWDGEYSKIKDTAGMLVYVKGRYASDLYDHLFKGNLIGASCTGKTKFLNCLMEKTSYDGVYHSTIGVFFERVRIDVPNKKGDGMIGISLQFWDNASQDRFMASTASFIKRTHFALLFYKDNELDKLIEIMKKYHFSQELIPTITFVLIQDRPGESLKKLEPLDEEVTSKLGVTQNFHFSLLISCQCSMKLFQLLRLQRLRQKPFMMINFI